MTSILGFVLVIGGLAAALGTDLLVRSIGRVWPREFTPADTHNLGSLAFLTRLLGIMVVVIGLGLIWVGLR